MEEKLIKITPATAALALLAITGTKWEKTGLSEEDIRPWKEAEQELLDAFSAISNGVQPA